MQSFFLKKAISPFPVISDLEILGSSQPSLDYASTRMSLCLFLMILLWISCTCLWPGHYTVRTSFLDIYFLIGSCLASSSQQNGLRAKVLLQPLMFWLEKRAVTEGTMLILGVKSPQRVKVNTTLSYHHHH